MDLINLLLTLVSLALLVYTTFWVLSFIPLIIVLFVLAIGALIIVNILIKD